MASLILAEPPQLRERIFVCSPLRATKPDGSLDLVGIEANIRQAAAYCRQVALAGLRPFAPHVFYTSVLDESSDLERALGIELGIEELYTCDRLWYWPKEVPNQKDRQLTSGMSQEVQKALGWGKPVEYGPDALATWLEANPQYIRQPAPAEQPRKKARSRK